MPNCTVLAAEKLCVQMQNPVTRMWRLQHATFLCQDSFRKHTLQQSPFTAERTWVCRQRPPAAALCV